MAQFSNLTLTNKGLALQAKAQTGTQLTFARVGFGDGQLASGESILDLTNLKNQKVTSNIASNEVIGDGTTRVRAVLTNTGLSAGFYLREVGLFATDPDEGEILYAYSNAGQYPDFLPAGTGNTIVETTISLITIIGNAPNVTATIPSGTFVTVQDFNERNTEVDSQLAENVQQISLKTTSFDEIKKNILRGNTGMLKRYTFPSEWTWTDAPIRIFTDGKRFFTDFDVSDFKNTGGVTYYVNPVSGDNLKDGLSEANALNTVYKAYTLANDGDTIILLDGIYDRTHFMQNQQIEKSINIIAKNPQKAIFAVVDLLIYTKTEGYNYIYQANRSATNDVIYYISPDQTFKYTKVNSLGECDATEGTWYTDGTLVYVHSIDNQEPSNNNTFVLVGSTSIRTTCIDKNVNLYLEGLIILGGNSGSVYFANSATYTIPNLYAKDCYFLYGRGGSVDGNAVNILGANKVYLQNCISAYAPKDGFNYHAQNGVVPSAIEVNCIGKYNGDNSISGTENTNNGSTMHEGGKIIRVNCTYYGNMGANCADVAIGTQALCLGCIAYKSNATSQDMYNADFATQQADAHMWLEKCIAFGSLYSLAYTTGTYMYIDEDTLYETKVGGGILTITE